MGYFKTHVGFYNSRNLVTKQQGYQTVNSQLLIYFENLDQICFQVIYLISNLQIYVHGAINWRFKQLEMAYLRKDPIEYIFLF